MSDVYARVGPTRVAIAAATKNLRAIHWDAPDAGMDRARRLDAAATELRRERPRELSRLAEHRDFALAVPTPDYFIPLLCIAGLAAADGVCQTRTFSEGYALGSLPMTPHDGLKLSP